MFHQFLLTVFSNLKVLHWRAKIVWFIRGGKAVPRWEITPSLLNIHNYRWQNRDIKIFFFALPGRKKNPTAWKSLIPRGRLCYYLAPGVAISLLIKAFNH